MPRISFNFCGWVSGAHIIEATDVNGNTVDVSQMEASALAAKLESGELFISLGDHLYASGDCNIELDAFEGIK